MKLGFVQSKPKLFATQANIERCIELIGDKKADLWVLPELASSGYVFRSNAEVAKVAEQIPAGPTCRLLQHVARELKTAFVVGLPERYGRKFYNSSALITARKVTAYRKVHLFAEEKRFFSPGDLGFGVEDVGGVKVGMMVCFDWFFPESARTLALKGAHVIAHPSNLVMPWGPDSMRTRSLENRVFSVTADRVGTERGLKFIGRSQVIGTKGEILYRASDTKEEARVITIDPGLAGLKRLNKYNDLLKDRRPQHYS